MGRTTDTPTPLGPDSVHGSGGGDLDDWDRLFDGEAVSGPARPLAAEPEAEAPTATRYLGFRVGRELYAVPIAELAEVVRSTEITPVPRVRPFVRGIVSVRGTIVPIVDLRRRLAFGAGEEGARPVEPEGRRGAAALRRILITSFGGESFGLLVDEVTHPFQLEPHEVEPPPVTLPRRLLEYVEGIGRVEERIYILLDLPVVLRFDAVLPLRGRGEGAA